MKTKTAYLFLLLWNISGAFAQQNFSLVLLSGVENGSYHLIAQDIQKIAQKDNVCNLQLKHTQGSTDNFRLITQTKDVQLAFSQYDVVAKEASADLLHGKGVTQNLRMFLPVGREQLHLVVKKGSPIKKLSDLDGKRVAIGTEGQGTYLTALNIKQIAGIPWQNVSIAFDSSLVYLLQNKIDAFFFVGAAPTQKLENLPFFSSDLLDLIPINYVPRLEREGYIADTIKAGTYSWIEKDIPTYSVQSVIITNLTNIAPQQEQQLLALFESIYNNISEIQQNADYHAAWKNVTFDFDSYILSEMSGIRRFLMVNGNK